jgi:hypothetical protein
MDCDLWMAPFRFPLLGFFRFFHEQADDTANDQRPEWDRVLHEAPLVGERPR